MTGTAWAKTLINSSLFNNMDTKKVKRLLQIVQGVTGANDTSRYIERLVDLMTEMQLNECNSDFEGIDKRSQVDTKEVSTMTRGASFICEFLIFNSDSLHFVCKFAAC